MRTRYRQIIITAVWLWLILSQAMTAFAGAGHPPQLDAFGNPLCIGDHVSGSKPVDGGSGTDRCCLSGCASTPLGTGPGSDPTSVRIAFSSGPAFEVAERERPPFPSTASIAARPRAPPAAG